MLCSNIIWYVYCKTSSHQWCISFIAKTRHRMCQIIVPAGSSRTILHPWFWAVSEKFWLEIRLLRAFKAAIGQIKCTFANWNSFLVFTQPELNVCFLTNIWKQDRFQNALQTEKKKNKKTTTTIWTRSIYIKIVHRITSYAEILDSFDINHRQISRMFALHILKEEKFRVVCSPSFNLNRIIFLYYSISKDL